MSVEDDDCNTGPECSEGNIACSPSEDTTRTPLQTLSMCPILSGNRELCRAASPSQVLHGFAQIFASRSLWTHSTKLEQRLLDEARHKEADALFYSTKKVNRVGAFISHVWGAPRWQKALALYYYMNINLAVSASVTTWVLLMAWMAVKTGPAGMGGNPYLLTVFVGGPMLSFFAVLLTGHHFVTTVNNLWLDKFCIHQTRAELKRQGVDALPEVVASSDRMIVLWNDTYFERLWCNAEVATFCSINNGSDKMEFLPLWLTPWILATMLLDIVSVFLSQKLFVLIPMAGTVLGGLVPSEESWLINFLAQFLGIGVAFSVAYLPVVIPSWMSFRFKLDNHEIMLAKCKQFELQKAKCTDENDRAIVEGLVADLWYDSEEPITEFNRFVNEDLSKYIVSRTGHLDSIPYRLCLLVYLPLLFSAAVNVFGCDQMPCEIAALAEIGPGGSVSQQMITSMIAWMVGIIGVAPTTYPVMLSLLCANKARFVNRPCLRRFSDLMAVIVSYVYMAFHEGFSAGLINTASARSAAGILQCMLWSAAVILYLTLLVLWNIRLFRKEALDSGMY